MLLEYKKSATAFVDQVEPQAVLTPLFKDNIRYWVFAYPVMALPSFLAAIWVFVTRIFNRLDKAAGFPSLYWRVPRNGADRSTAAKEDC